jgi:hypothetical protein
LALFRAFPDTRFVLLHGAYPRYDEVLAFAKHGTFCLIVVGSVE